MVAMKKENVVRENQVEENGGKSVLIWIQKKTLRGNIHINALSTVSVS